jgi:dTDP-4-dehydrorhamnose 3,5-epimerase-like enzyme
LPCLTRSTPSATVTVESTRLPGVLILQFERSRDEYGSFARAYCQLDLAEHGIDLTPVQISLALSGHLPVRASPRNLTHCHLKHSTGVSDPLCRA